MDYIGVLKEKYNNFKEQMEKAQTVDELESIYNESVSFYSKELIPAFFSSRGEGKHIKDMYQKLDERKHQKYIRESKIESVDLNMANGIYRDYLSGMQTFILETCDTCIDPSVYVKESENCRTKLSTAKENDGLFIESIFGGSNNRSHIESIVESTKNVEYLVDFIDYLKEESTNCGDVISKVKSSIAANESGCTLLTESVRLMTESMHNFVHHTIMQIFDSYDRITTMLDGNTGSTDSTQEVEKFKIW